jgi:hypothetical protein
VSCPTRRHIRVLSFCHADIRVYAAIFRAGGLAPIAFIWPLKPCPYSFAHKRRSRPRGRHAPKKPSAVEQPAAQTKVAVSGRVLGPDGKPVAGAKLYLGYTGPKDMKYPVRATSGDDGHFKFTVEQSELDKASEDYPTINVMAVAAGHGCDWAAVGPAGEEVTLRLVKDVPIGVRILDPEGKPVAGGPRYCQRRKSCGRETAG